MNKQIKNIRGHHLVEIANFMHDPKGVERRYLKEGYGRRFVKNQSRIFKHFLRGRVNIQLTDWLDDICAGDCCYRPKISISKGELPCDDSRARAYDVKVASIFGFKIGKTYSFEETRRSFERFYHGFWFEH